VARYPRVPPGSFSFVVEARNEDGVWSAAPAVANFQILPLWRDTAWFRWGVGLLAAVLIGNGLIRRVRNAESRNRQLMLAIQERDLAEERIHRQQRELEHVARVATAGELATSLAHELNQPLMAIVSNAAAGDLMLSNPDMGKDVVREALDDIAADGKRASEVIKGLRAFLKRGTVEFEQLYVNQVVRDVLVLLGSEIRESGVNVRLDLDGDLPTVEGNRVQLQQVLVNLVMNALEAMCSQGTECRLSVKTRSVDEGVSITVHDTGPGLPPGGEDEVFEAFVTTKEGGMGVGLAISRTIVAAHRGRIRAGNHVDGGAEFVITLPSLESTPVSAGEGAAVSG
jgi:two-component system sensor kinase FixL